MKHFKNSFTNPPLPKAETPVWICGKESICNGWIRENFAFDNMPLCPLCGSDMIRGTKLLPVLINGSVRESQTESSRRNRRRRLPI